ncbi:MAG: YCF48-related protein [Bacteroidota bacterium]
MNKKALIIISIFLFVVHVCYAQWTAQTAPAGTVNLYSVFAMDANNVAAAGDAKIPKTNDGGATWTSNLTVTNVKFNTVHTGTTNAWYSLSVNSTYMVKVNLLSGIGLYGGRPDSVLSLHFYKPGCAVAVGQFGKLSTTCDTGATWQYHNSGVFLNINSVWFADTMVGVACTISGHIIRTMDGGMTWSGVTSNTVSNLNGVNFPTPTTGYICGTSGTFLKTTNAGMSWVSMPIANGANYNGVYFLDSLTGYVVGSGGVIMKTTDGAVTWSQMVSGTTQTLNSVHFADTATGWVVGNNATILKFGAVTTGMTNPFALATISVYPNPNNGNFNLDYDLPSSKSLFTVKDVVGRIVYQQEIMGQEGNEKIIADLRAGLYIWEFTNNGMLVNKGKMMITK